MNMLAFDTCLDKTYITLADNNKILHSEIINSDAQNYHSAYLISTIIKRYIGINALIYKNRFFILSPIKMF